MESEFFGHEEGSFTGGVKGGKSGEIWKRLIWGSMFLDEINAMSLKDAAEASPSSAGKIERVGGTRAFLSTSASFPHQHTLDYLVEQGFSPSLFYRLNIITVKIPPLCAAGKKIFFR